MMAFNIRSGVFESVPHYESDADYTLHKPQKPPYQCRSFKVRSLWVNEDNDYVLWIHVHKSKYHYLLYRFNRALLDDEVEVGECVDEYKFDKDLYDAEFTKYVAQHARVVKKRPATLVPKKPKSLKQSSSEAYRRGCSMAVFDAPVLASAPVATAATDDAAKSIEADASADSEDVPLTKRQRPGKPAASNARAADASPDKTAADGGAANGAAADEAAVDATDEATEAAASSEEIDKLKKLLSEQTARADSTQAELDNTNRLYKNYQQRKQNEVRKMKEEGRSSQLIQEKKKAEQQLADATHKLRDASNELTTTKQKLQTAEDAMAPDAMEEAHRVNPRNAYHKLINMISNKFDAAIDDCEASFAKQSSTLTTTFEFEESYGRRVQFTDVTAIAELNKLTASHTNSATVSSVSYCHFGRVFVF